MKYLPQWKHCAYAIVSTLVLFALWIVFVFSVGRNEMIVGAACSIVAGCFATFVGCRRPVPFRPSLRNWLEAWRLPWYIVNDSAVIVLAFLRDLLGRRNPSLFRAAPFAAGSQQSQPDTARRVLAVAYTTVTPNSIVVGIDIKRNLLLFHQIERSPISRMTRNLGAKA